jgi:hypothetical protein
MNEQEIYRQKIADAQKRLKNAKEYGCSETIRCIKEEIVSLYENAGRAQDRADANDY